MADPTERSAAIPASGAGTPKPTAGNAGAAGANQRVDNPAGRGATAQRSPADLANDAKQSVREGAKQGQHLAAELGDQAKQRVCEATDQAKETTRQYAVDKKRQIAEELGVFSSAVQNAAKTLRDEEHDTVAQYIEAAAEQLDSARHAVENKPVGEFFEDLQEFTRRRPEIVFGGLFVAGLAAMRFAKASRPTPRQSGMNTRSGSTGQTLPARRANAGPPPGFRSAGEGAPRPVAQSQAQPASQPRPIGNPGANSPSSPTTQKL